jgi:hypothetical protein
VEKTISPEILTGKLDKLWPLPVEIPVSADRKPLSAADEARTAPENPKAV